MYPTLYPKNRCGVQMGYRGTDMGDKKSRQAAKIKGSSLVLSSRPGNHWIPGRSLLISLSIPINIFSPLDF